MKLGSLVALVFGVGFVAAACNPDSMTRELDNHLTALIRGGDAVSQVRLAPDVRYYLSVSRSPPSSSNTDLPAGTPSTTTA